LDEGAWQEGRLASSTFRLMLDHRTSRPLPVSLALIVATLLLGLAIRFAPLGLPVVVRKYGGSMLWAAMIYWIVSTILARRGPGVAAAATAAIAVGVELFKLVEAPGLDAFRRTTAGVLLLGRVFSVWDFVAYGVAIGLAAGLDLRKRWTP
jgi:hypothetical protein